MIPTSTDHTGQQIEISTTDALNLSPFEAGRELMLSDSFPYIKATIKAGEIEFLTESEGSVLIPTELVKDMINKQYYIGQKFSPNQR